jgi:hypothetical protein
MIEAERKEPVGRERRKSERQSIGHYLLQLDPGGGRAPFSCFIWDLSETGARLRLGSYDPLPVTVQVKIGNVTHRARIVWRVGFEIGIEFIQEKT